MEFFPEHILDSSIHTSILVGLIVLWLATETIGWNFSGFIVAGYLAAILIAHPMSFVATFVEAILTYGIAWWLGAGAAASGLWSRSFGRERFLLFVLVSVPVRLIVEGIAGPHLQAMLGPLSLNPAWVRGEFFSIGIVLVPLVANSFWKVGLARGVAETGTVSLVTWLILAFVIVPITNLQLGHFELSFENFALHFLAIPKLYIVLLATAAIASRNNVRYGWDFNGILVPSLLAIIGFVPLKFLATVFEIVVLVWAYRALMAIPFLARLNLEGPRRLVSMYALSYTLKFIVAAALFRVLPQIYVSDLFGFGYVLTSLVAVRCFQKRDIPRVLLPVVVTAVQGLVAGSLLSLALWGFARIAAPPPPAQEERPLVPLERSILVSEATVRARPASSGDGHERLVRTLLDGLGSLDANSSVDQAEAVRRRWSAEGLSSEWTVRADGRRCLGGRQAKAGAVEPLGIPAVWWCGGNGPALLVVEPLEDRPALISAAFLAHHGDFSVIALAGTDQREGAWLGIDGSPVPREIGELRAAMSSATTLLIESGPGTVTQLEPRSSQAQVDAAALREHLPGLTLRFRAAHGRLQAAWETLPATDAILSVSVTELDAALGKMLQDLDASGDLASELARATGSALRRGDGRYDTRTPEERLAYVDLLLAEAMSIARESPRGARVPARVAYLARALDAEAATTSESSGGTAMAWVIREKAGAPRGWGTWFLRPGAQGDWLVAAPRAIDEPGTAWAAKHLLLRLDGQAMFVAGSVRGVSFGNEGDALADIDASLPVESMAVRQALRPVGEAGLTRGLVLVRERTVELADDGALRISAGRESFLPAEQERLRKTLGSALEPWPSVRFEGGGADSGSLASGTWFPVRYLNAIERDRALVLWFPSRLLGEIEGSEDTVRRIAWYRSEGITVAAPAWRAELIARIDSASPLPLPEVRKLLAMHTQTSTEAPLEALKERKGTHVEVLHDGSRLQVLVWGDDWLCRASARGEQAVSSSTAGEDGCWRLK